MVGLSNVAFRELIRSYVPTGIQALRFTEMLSSRRIPSERLDEAEALRCAPNESFFVPQLLGNEERFIVPSVKKLLLQRPWGIDINMGCPTSHTLKHNWGVLLMGNKEYAADVVKMTKGQTTLPVSVKLRSGLGSDDSLDYLSNFTDALESAGADWLTVHCRPSGQGHKGEANWERVGELAKRRSIPVVANGDIQTADDAISVISDYGADGAMIGRGATARPWMLWQIAEKLGFPGAPEGREGEKAPSENEGQEYFRACIRYLGLLDQYFLDTPFALRKFHFFVANGVHFFQFGHAFWKVTTKAKSLAQAKEIVANYATKNSHPMTLRVQFH